MITMNFLFFVFAGLALVGSLFVIFSANPVHSVLSLILVFCSTSMLLLLLRVDFLSILFVVVYVGAIAVLFLFVVMMLNIKLVQLNESIVRWLPLAFLVAAGLTSNLFYVFSSAVGGYSVESRIVLDAFNDCLAVTTAFDPSLVGAVMAAESFILLGSALYGVLSYSFVLSSFVLLVALLGAITLTVGSRRLSRRQHVYKQVSRDFFGAIRFYK
jgi:NADH:ubiquinone oxidoreductase subunit 6 (subunit J)